MKHRSLINLLTLSILTCILCLFCNYPQPIPKGKEAFIGTWQSQSGFKIDIKSLGTADVTEGDISKNPDNSKLNIGIAPDYAMGMLVGFIGDSILIISKPTVRAREYRIDRNPYSDWDTVKMVLNGEVLIKQK
jgi:hypothetical protein